MKVVVVESPAKAKTINKYLGKDFTVLASYGHVRDLPSKDGSVDPENNFAMNYVVPKDSEKHIREIAKALKDADELILATDPDREGEAISWHVLDELDRRKKLTGKKVSRVIFHEITKNAILQAMDNPREVSMDMVNAQQARRALDYLVGFNLSPVLWRKVRPGLSAGRVQSVALRLICEREAEIKSFDKEEYWTVAADFLPDGAKNTFSANLTHLDGEKLKKFSINSEDQAKAAHETLATQSWSVSEITKKQSSRRAAPPFITSTLQQEASRKLSFTARKTMTLAQRLYEGIDIDGQTVGLITYMRTDSVNLSNDAIAAARQTIEKLYGKEYVPEKPNYYKTKAKNAQEAHEAIRPTDFAIRPEKLASTLDRDMLRLYELIWKRAMACQMAPAKLDQTGLNIASADKKHVFRATGSIITFPGFIKVYRESVDDNASDGLDESLLPDVKEGQAMDAKTIKPEQHFTEPPPRFSEATLVKALEEHGIGRPSTYASIISTLQDRGYVHTEQRRFFPEDVGIVVNKFLTEHFETYVDIGFTANMEDKLDAISRGEDEWQPMLAKFWQPFHERVVDKTESVKKSDVTTESTGETCPTCKEGELVIRLGRYGRFKGCNRYPECKHIENLDGSTNKPKEPPKPTGFDCPDCSDGEIVERKSRRGKVFYGCNQYPKCKFAMWDAPQAQKCPECGCPVTGEKETKRLGTVRKCPKCAWQDPPAPAKKAGAKKPAAKRKTTKRKTTSKKA